MKKYGILLFFVAFLSCAWAVPTDWPANVQKTFKKMYPTATEVSWTQQQSYQGNYYVADLTVNGFDTHVWFDPQANWVMTLTDWESTDELSPTLYNAFSMGDYAAGQVEDVTQAVFPHRPTVVVIKVGQQNIDIQYQLFYAPNGALLRAHNMEYTEGFLWPDTFIFE